MSLDQQISKEQMKKIHIKDDWFEVYQLPYEVYAISEPKHYEEVQSFLIKGETHSVLLDTGMGIGNIKPVVEQLVDGQVIVVNSHFHFDHVADNHRFDEAYLYHEKNALQMMKKGCSKEEMAYNVQASMFFGEPPASFNQETYAIQPMEPLLVEDGHVFDLGNRKLQVIHTPGHTQDSIMLWDQANGLLFTGDSLYKGPICLHFHSPTYGFSNLKEYIQSMKKIEKLAGSLRCLYCSHNEIMAEPSLIKEVVDSLESLFEKNHHLPISQLGLHAYDDEDDNMARYDFEHFSVIVRKVDISQFSQG